MSDVLIQVENLGKRFCRDLKKSLWYGVKDSLIDLFGLQGESEEVQLRPQEFWANREISFEVKRGQCLGLVGRNGAGKTTLLKMLNGLIKPDEGEVRISGRVGALIALGAGFNPVLTGRENITVNGSILGLSRSHIRDRTDKIVEFAGIADAIDAPVRTYSSGMQVRLGFATAVSLIEPDVLFLDEVLAVGDVAFRAKCYNEVARLKNRTATVFVSHNMSQIATTSNCGLVLDKGRMASYGDPGQVIETYNTLNSGQISDNEGHLLLHDEISSAEFHLNDDRLEFGAGLVVSAAVESSSSFAQAYYDIVFYSLTGEIVAQWNGPLNDHVFPLKAGMNSVDCEIQNVNLTAGEYRMGIVIRCAESSAVLAWSYKQHMITLVRSNTGLCAYQMS